MTMGVDTLGHVVGILGGTLAADTPEASGSEGVYNVRLHSSDGGVSNFFSVDVSHWNQGDVFVGGGQWVYQVYREDASFKTDVTVPDDPSMTYGSTTGCAVNWRTGEVWATNFDDVHPALNVITRHAGNNPLPYTDPSRRLSTERYGPGNTLTPFPGNLNPFDINPESVAFNNAGEMLVGHSFGFFNDNGDIAAADGTPTVLFDENGGWVYVDAAGQPLLDIDGNMIPSSALISPGGFFEKWIQGAPPFNILGQNGLPLAVPPQGGMDLHRYIPDANGNYNQADRQFYDLHYGYTGIDTLDLLSDQTTVNYTSEDWYIHRYDIGTSVQLPVVGSTVVGESRPISSRSLYGIRALPPGDGTGGYLAVNEFHIDRLDKDGHVVQSYDVRGDADYPADPDLGYPEGDVNGWFAIAIAPDARTFWAATRKDVFHFDIASGQTIGPKIRATVGTLHSNAELAGLCVMDEYRAAQEVCGPTGLGNGIDDDHDGTIDEGCFRVEICSAFSPGDDDGDGLIDYNDPDCGVPPSQQCVPDGPTDNSVGGICDRADYEGDTVFVPGIPKPCQLCDDWTFNYSATGLPDGLVMDPQTGDVTGMPYYSIVNPNSETSPPVVFSVTVNSTWLQAGGRPASFSKTFNWTIYNRNRVPVAVDDGVQTVNAGASFSFDVRANDSDIDGDNPLTIVSFSQPPSGQGSVVQSGQNLVYTAPASGFSGITSFTYSIQDTYNPAGVSNVATVRVRVNNLPLAANDSYVTPKNTPLVASVAGNDTPSIDGGNTWTVTSGPASGVLVLAPTGAFTYTPALNFTGTVTFNYQLCDADNDCANAVATIKINDVPAAVNDSFITALNTPITATVTGNDTPSADGGNVWTKTSNPLHGTATVTAAGGFTYTPNLNYSGLDSFTYTVCDVDNDCATATVTIRINDVPKAVNDSYTTPKNTPLAGSVAGNDTPSIDAPNTWSVTVAPTSGVLAFLSNGTFTYTPALNFTGTVTFTYKVCDVDNDCATAVATIKINDVPVAVNDSFTTNLNTAITNTVTGNDTPSADGGNVWTRVTNAAHGTVTVTAAGSFTYTPALNYSGTDSFTYKVCDVDNDCSTATVNIRINDVPVAVNDSYTTPKDVVVNASVTGNDTPSVDGGNTWTKVTDPAHGTLTMFPNGNFIYTPAPGYTGTDSFNYKVCDVDNDCSTATVTIKINDVPVARNDFFATPKNTALTATAAGNDFLSADGGNVWTKLTNPAHGTVTAFASNGTFTYVPNTGYTGTDSFTYKLCDADNDCSTATVTIKINDVPLAVNDSYTTTIDSPLFANVSVNDTPSNDVPNLWTATSNPSHGTVSMTSLGSISYAPATGYTGTDSFTYNVCDADGDCSTATVTIRINGVPVAVNDSFTTPKNTALTATVTGNDTPSADGGNVWAVTSTTTHAVSVIMAPDGTFTYTPVNGFTGTDTFTYKVCDLDNDCSPATVTIKINDVPVALDDSFTATKNTPFNGTVTGNDTPSADGGNTWSAVTQPASGTVVMNPNGTFTYTPPTGFSGAVTFTYKVCDFDNDCSTATVTIRINDVPVAINDTFTTAEDTPVSGTLTGNDTPSSDGGNVWSKTSNPSNGTATVNPDGTFTYTPNANFNGTDSFTYKVCDVDGDCSTATVTITITPGDDVPVARDDAFTTAEDTPVSGSLTGNDTPSPDGGNVWSKVTNPSNGAATVNTNGTFTYTPNANFYGTDTFTYQICDADGDCSIATVTITISPVDEVPLAVNDNFTTTVNTPISTSVIANDTPSPDGGNVWSVVTGPTAAMGTLSFAPTGTFTFTPATGFTGTATFTYKVCDIDGDCASAVVSILIPSLCEPGPFTTYTQGGWGATPNGGNPAALLAANFTTVYPSGFVQIGGAYFLKFTSAAAIKNYLPSGGTASKLTGSYTNPTSSKGGVFSGQVLALQLNVDFSAAGIKKRGLGNQIVVSGKMAGATVTQVLAAANQALGGGALPSGVSISDLNTIVDAINNNYDNGNCDGGYLQDPPSCNADHQPVAVDDAFTTAEDTAVSGSLKTNDTPSADGGNVWTKLTNPAHGTAVVNTDATFTYTPSANFSGTDSFTYRLCDTDGDCDDATVTITITAVDDAPVAVNDSFTTLKNTAITGTVTGNDTPSGDGGNVWTKVTSPAHGTATVTATGGFTYTPTTNYVGADSFTYKICDADNDCSTATVSITISAPANTGLVSGDTATIGFWHNGNGQALIKSLNGGPNATNLGNWLAANYPYLFGAQAGSVNNMAGKTNTQVAAYDLVLFGSDKWLNQVLGGAIAAYVTNSTLAGGNFAVNYGFNYSATGTGAKTYNVGSYGAAIGLANNTTYTIAQLLQQANLRKQQGTYDSNAFNVIFSDINETGDIL